VSVCFVKLLLWLQHFLAEVDETFSPLPAACCWGSRLVCSGCAWRRMQSRQPGAQQPGRLRMIALYSVEIVATAGCYASETPSIFGPSLFIGAMMGGAIGHGPHSPDFTGSDGACARRRAAFACRAHLTSVIMIFQ
jgi:H+/Cl- antiporter ClcA